MRLQLFHDWILFAKQQLQFVSLGEQHQNFNDLIQKEQGLQVWRSSAAKIFFLTLWIPIPFQRDFSCVEQ